MIVAVKNVALSSRVGPLFCPARPLIGTSLTVSGDVPLLPLKFASPEYVAVIGCEPSTLKVKLHAVIGSVVVQLAAPSVMVMTPVGVPTPGELTVSEVVIAVGCPNTAGLGTIELMLVVVPALFTECAALTEVAPLKLLLPPYCAVKDFAPAEVKAMLHAVVGRDAVHD